MSNIHQNDELLRVQDENYDIVFNYDEHENGGVAVHAEKDGQNQKVSPEYARAALVKKIGAGYDEISDGNITEIDGKKYLTPLGGGRVTKHSDVTKLIDNENISFNQAGRYNFMVSNRQGVILDPSHTYTFVIDGTRFENLIPFADGLNLDHPYQIGADYTAGQRPMDFSEYPFHVSSYAIIIPSIEPSGVTHIITLIDESVGSEVTITQPMDPKYLPEGGFGWTEGSKGTLFNVNGVVKRLGSGMYQATLSNGIDFAEIKQKYEAGSKLFVTVNGATYTDVVLSEDDYINRIEFCFNGNVNRCTIWENRDSDDGWRYSSHTDSIVPVGDVTFSMDWDDTKVHKINEKYLPEAMIVKIIYNESDDMFLCNHTYDEIVAAFPNIIFVDPEDVIGYSCLIDNGLYAHKMEANVNSDDETIVAIYNKLFIVRPDNIVEFSVSSRHFDSLPN